jgi:hypothetical protein
VDAVDRGQHRADEGRGGERSGEADGQRCASGGLGDAGSHCVATTRAHPEPLKGLAGSLQAVTAEPAVQLLCPVAHEQATDHHAHQKTDKLHVASLTLVDGVTTKLAE